jgi:hypothetical protein
MPTITIEFLGKPLTVTVPEGKEVAPPGWRDYAFTDWDAKKFYGYIRARDEYDAKTAFANERGYDYFDDMREEEPRYSKVCCEMVTWREPIEEMPYHEAAE